MFLIVWVWGGGGFKNLKYHYRLVKPHFKRPCNKKNDTKKIKFWPVKMKMAAKKELFDLRLVRYILLHGMCSHPVPPCSSTVFLRTCSAHLQKFGFVHLLRTNQAGPKSSIAFTFWVNRSKKWYATGLPIRGIWNARGTPRVLENLDLALVSLLLSPKAMPQTEFK